MPSDEGKREQPTGQRFNRRTVLRGGMLVMSAQGMSTSWNLGRNAWGDEPVSKLRIGLVTDLHYADKNPAGSRHYRETLGKLEDAADEFTKQPLDFLVELGDFIDAADSVEVEQKYLKTINEPFSAICADRHYVLGNHCVDTLTKAEFLGMVQQQDSYYSFDRGGIHFVVLDSCFRGDGQPYGRRNFKWTDANVPPAELDWLKQDLKQTELPVVVFAHQRLDVDGNYGVRNNSAVRQILEASNKVLAVMQGHSHKNDYRDVGGIHYCTLVAMVEGSGKASSGYSVMEVDPKATIRVSGFQKQDSYRWPRSGNG